MSWYYSLGKGNNSEENIVVQIVNGELRHYGDGLMHPSQYWINFDHDRAYNLDSELISILAGGTPTLRPILLNIYNEDKDFLKRILPKLWVNNKWNKFCLHMFEYDMDRRKELDEHVPEKEKFAVFQATDNGLATGNAIAVGEVLTTGDWQEDRKAAVIDGLVQGLGWSKEKAEAAGWFTAQPYKEYLDEVRERFEALKEEIEILEDAQ